MSLTRLRATRRSSLAAATPASLFEPRAARQVASAANGNAEAAVSFDWSEEEVVLLHWRLLQKLGGLGDPQTPLDEKLDILRWVFADPIGQRKPFSFASCVNVIAASPLSPLPFMGGVDAETIRDWIRHHVRAWLGATIDRYPSWAARAVLENPGWVERQLAKNPQWLNEQVRAHAAGDLFGRGGPASSLPPV